MRDTERIEHELSAEAARTLADVVALAQWVRRVIVAIAVVAVALGFIAAAGHTL
jgi:hypothetical protein